ncbi:tetratricopeptide repeat protein [Curtobacterium sp. MCBA15_013]|uniref:tetratricopeptide repeat protein n=1 Tax=Curtobacterium sp. MCBA15_013 TaxID=1898739 RepID=UPI0008DDCE95|nr:tetratricopeptide repeat protein [Curtobacterium sp. MCBA15_013]OII18390.1 hypothetical protein BIV01_02255 [Curtobacterium sp. MCBA15_013]
MDDDLKSIVSSGWEAYRADRHGDAQAIFERALCLDSDNVDAWLGLGRTHRLQGHFDQAVYAFTHAHRVAPEAARPLCERGAILILQGQYRESLADYEHARTVEPEYPPLDSYFAEIYLYLDEPVEALRAAVKGLSGDSLMCRANVAHALLAMGDAEDAIAIYQALAPVTHPGKQRSMRSVLLNDFRLLDEAGIRWPAMSEAVAALTT